MYDFTSQDKIFLNNLVPFFKKMETGSKILESEEGTTIVETMLVFKGIEKFLALNINDILVGNLVKEKN